jgi:hypothetical protein
MKKGLTILFTFIMAFAFKAKSGPASDLPPEN